MRLRLLFFREKRGGGLKSRFWKTDWFLGLLVLAAFALFSRTSDLIPSLERKAYDLAVRATSREPAKNIAIIAIDEESLDKIGRWPWSRDVLAKLTDQLAAAKAKVIANTILLSEPQLDPGYQYITKLLGIAAPASPEPQPAPAAQPPGATQASAVQPPSEAPPPNPQMEAFVALLKEAEQALNSDRRLAESYAKAGNVIQPMLFTLGRPLGKPDKPLPPFALKNAVAAAKGSDTYALPSLAVK